MEEIINMLENKDFIRWVSANKGDSDLDWQKLIEENSEEKKVVEEVRRLFAIFSTKKEFLEESEKMVLFSNILHEIRTREDSRKQKNLFLSLLKYASIVIVFLSVGILTYQNYSTTSNDLVLSEDFIVPKNLNDFTLIRGNGDSIVLHNSKTQIKHLEDGRVLINEDSLMALKQDNLKKSEMNQLIVPFGKTTRITLSDGTIVFLNSGSRLVYPDRFSGNSREVLLQGEAYFDVAKVKKSSFVVKTTDIDVKVLGTKFNVSAYKEDKLVETILEEGKVQIHRSNKDFFAKSVELSPGQKASFNKSGDKIEVKEVDVDEYILWKDGLLKFSSESLVKVISKVERFYNVKINYDMEDIMNIKMSGKLDLDTDINVVLDIISEASVVEIARVKENVFAIQK